MDFLKKFFENIYLFVVDTIRDFFGGLLILLRFPRLGPHIMLRRHRNEQRNGIDPSLFLFLASVVILIATFTNILRNATAISIFLGNEQTSVSIKDFIDLLSSGKPNARLNQLIVAGFVMALLVGALIGSITALRRLEFRTRKRRLFRLRNLRTIEAYRLPAANYAAVLAMLLGFLLMLLILRDGWVARAFVSFAQLLNAPFGFARLFDIGSFPFTAFDASLIFTLGLFSLPTTLPLARILFWPELPLRKHPPLLKWAGSAFLTALLMLIPLAGGVTTFLWLTLTSTPRAAVTFSDVTCEIADWPSVRLSAHYRNTGTASVTFSQDSFGLDVSASSIGDNDEVLQLYQISEIAVAKVQSVGPLQDRHTYNIAPGDSSLITFEALAPEPLPPLNETTESWSGQCTLIPGYFWKTHDPENLLPFEAVGHFEDIRPKN